MSHVKREDNDVRLVVAESKKRRNILHISGFRVQSEEAESLSLAMLGM